MKYVTINCQMLSQRSKMTKQDDGWWLDWGYSISDKTLVVNINISQKLSNPLYFSFDLLPYLMWWPTWLADQPAHLANARQPGGTVCHRQLLAAQVLTFWNSASSSASVCCGTKSVILSAYLKYHLRQKQCTSHSVYTAILYWDQSQSH